MQNGEKAHSPSPTRVALCPMMVIQGSVVGDWNTNVVHRSEPLLGNQCSRDPLPGGGFLTSARYPGPSVNRGATLLTQFALA